MTVSVINLIGFAFNRTARTLFKPFQIGKWFALGFCAWSGQLRLWSREFYHLLQLDPRAFSGVLPAGGGPPGGSGTTVAPTAGEILGWLLNNLVPLILLVAFGLVVMAALALLVLWLSSRG